MMIKKEDTCADFSFCVPIFAISGNNNWYGETNDQILLSVMIRMLRSSMYYCWKPLVYYELLVKFTQSKVHRTSLFVRYMPCKWVSHEFRITRQKSFFFFFFHYFLLLCLWLLIKLIDRFIFLWRYFSNVENTKVSKYFFTMYLKE